MRLSAHLTFGGDCAAAFRFYERVLGGRLQTLVTYGETAMASAVAPAWRDKIAHTTLLVGGTALMGADVEGHEPARGFFVLVSVVDAGEAARVFAALADGGQIRMPLAPTFWSPAFGMVVDRFGTPWEVSAEAG